MDWKQIGKALLFPPGWLIAVLSAVSAGLLAMVFIKGEEQSVWAWGVYALSFYTLTAACAFCALVLPKRLRRMKQSLSRVDVIRRGMTDRQYRARLSLELSLGANVLYIALQAVQWYLQRSWWFVVLAAYYGILALLRLLLVRYVQRSIPAQWRRSRICAGLLLLVNLSLSGAVLMILYQDRGFDYGGILVYVVALYTFYSAIHAVVDIIRYRKLGSPVLSTAKTVSLCAALVAMLNLETAMLHQFGGELTGEQKRLFIILTGAGVSIVVVAMSVRLMVRSTIVLRREKHGA